MSQQGDPGVFWYNTNTQTCIRKVDDLVSHEAAATYCNDRGENLAAFRDEESLTLVTAGNVISWLFLIVVGYISATMKP